MRFGIAPFATAEKRGGKIMTKKLSKEAEQLIRTVCADYERRARLVRREMISPRMQEMYVSLNAAIDGAMSDVYERTRVYAPKFSEQMRADIAECRGYARSPLSGLMSEGSYKKYKRMCKTEIAEALLLL